MEYYSAVKKNEILSFATTCMELEVIMPLPLNVKGNWTSSVSSLKLKLRQNHSDLENGPISYSGRAESLNIKHGDVSSRGCELNSFTGKRIWVRRYSNGYLH
ncbi:uncharacterized protein LOC107966870 isoform X1 [Pan troglodytes]|uniref:uncharacterized protein LOC107966870 isoform X1 n=1 Tax=Pan troglodytes TaxID=9598 RepID=UPI0030137DF4